MRKTVVRIGILCLLALCVCVSALAADIGHVETPGDTVQATTNNGKGVNITYPNAKPEAQYVVYCTTQELNLTEGKVPTANNVAYYRHEVGRGLFDVFPNKLTEGQTYYVYLSASGDDNISGLTLVATFQYGGGGEEHTLALGHVCGEDDVGALDAQWALLMSVGKTVNGIPWTPDQIWAANVDGEGDVSALDAQWILERSVGKRDENWSRLDVT